jgi:hypothetical protein
MDDLHPEPHAHAEITLSRRRSQGAVGGEDTVVNEPGGSVELREESLDAPAEAVLGVGDCLEDGGTNDGDSGLLLGLTVARAESLPPDGGVVAAVEDVQSLEGNVRLLAVVGAELFTGGESDSVDNVGSLATTVADDVDSGTPVDKVHGKCLLSELESVALDELLEDAGDLLRVLIGQALVLVLALVSLPGTAPAPRALVLPVTTRSRSSVSYCNRSRCGKHGRNHGRGECDDGCGAHVDGWKVE